MKATIFKDFVTVIEDKGLIVLTKQIIEGTYRSEVEEIRSLNAEGRFEDADRKKNQLLAFTPSGTFKGGRKSHNLDEYSGCIVLDIDNLTEEQYLFVFEQAKSCQYTFCCFRSPRGRGLKILVNVSSGKEHHEIAFNQLADTYEQLLLVKIDRSGKDITRLCYFSYDPNGYKNINCAIYPVQLSVPLKIEKSGKELQNNEEVATVAKFADFASQFQNCVELTESKFTFTEGSRNNFVHYLTCNCNRAGIPQEIALELILCRFNYDDKEIRATVKSGYENHKEDFAKFANLANVSTQIAEDYLKQTPFIPVELYSQMPDIIHQGAGVFQQAREKDVFLTGALAILSGCLPGVKGIYDGQEVFPNLYSFTIAPAASGKGAMKFAKMLADNYHEFVLQASKELAGNYKTELAEHKARRQSTKGKDRENDEPPSEPPFKVIFIPANTSYAKILSHLEQNDGFGIICETEADTMGNALKQDWGGYNDMLRKAFHHERISSSRKANNEFIEVNAPRLSVALTGTPGQVTGLIESSQDGLFSRFLFYAFKVEPKWKDVSPLGNQVNLTEHFKMLSGKVYSMVEFFQQQETNVELTREQWNQLNTICAEWLNDVTSFTAEEAASVVKRLGLIIFRIAMLFTALRKFENGEASLDMVCSDNDFNTALKLGTVYLKHSLLMFHNLPKQQENTYFKGGDNKRKFFDALPNEFTRQDAVNLGKKFDVKDRTVDYLLKNLIGKYLTQPKTGHYKKMQ